MKLYAIDQVNITAVGPDTLQPGAEFEVSDAYGNELLEKVPHLVSKSAPQAKAERKAKNKAAPAPANKGQ